MTEKRPVSPAAKKLDVTPNPSAFFKPRSSTEDWLSIGKCRFEPDAMFVKGAAQNRAKHICNGCPVKTECLTDALDNKTKGVWGGMTDRERAILLKGNNHVTSWREVIVSAERRYPRAYMKAKKSGEPLPSLIDLMREDALKIYGPTPKEKKKPEAAKQTVSKPTQQADRPKDVVASSKPINTEPTVPAGFITVHSFTKEEDPFERLERLREQRRKREQIQSPFGTNTTRSYAADPNYFENRDRPASKAIEGDDEFELVDEKLLLQEVPSEELFLSEDEPPEELFVPTSESEIIPQLENSQAILPDESLEAEELPLQDPQTVTQLTVEPLKEDEGEETKKRRRRKTVRQQPQQETGRTSGSLVRREDHAAETKEQPVSEQTQQSDQSKAAVDTSQPIIKEPTVPPGFLPTEPSSTDEDPFARLERLREKNRKRNEIQGPFGKVAPVWTKHDPNDFENRSRPPSKPIGGESEVSPSPTQLTGAEGAAPSPAKSETVFAPRVEVPQPTSSLTPAGELVAPRRKRHQPPVGRKKALEVGGGRAKEKRAVGKKPITDKELVANWKAMQQLMEGKPFTEVQLKGAKADGLISISPRTFRRRFGEYKTSVQEMNKLCDLYPDVEPYKPSADVVLSSTSRKEKYSPKENNKGRQPTSDTVLDAAWSEIVRLNEGKRLTFGAIDKWRKEGSLAIGSTPLKRLGTMEEIITEMTKRTGIELKQDGGRRRKERKKKEWNAPEGSALRKSGRKPTPDAVLEETWKKIIELSEGKQPKFTKVAEWKRDGLIPVGPTAFRRYGNEAEIIETMTEKTGIALIKEEGGSERKSGRKPVSEEVCIASWKAMLNLTKGKPVTDRQIREAKAAGLIGVSPEILERRYGSNYATRLNELIVAHPEIEPYDPSKQPKVEGGKNKGKQPTSDEVLKTEWLKVIEFTNGEPARYSDLVALKKAKTISVGPDAFTRLGGIAEINKKMAELTGIPLKEVSGKSERRIGGRRENAGMKPLPDEVFIKALEQALILSEGEPFTRTKLIEWGAEGKLGVAYSSLQRKFGGKFEEIVDGLWELSKTAKNATSENIDELPEQTPAAISKGTSDFLIKESVASLGEALGDEDFLVFFEEEDTEPQEDEPVQGLIVSDESVQDSAVDKTTSAADLIARTESLVQADIIYLPGGGATEEVNLSVEMESESRFGFQEEEDTRSASQVIRDSAEWVFEEYYVRHDAMEVIQDAQSVESVILSTRDNLIAVAEKMGWEADSPEFYFVCASLYTQAARNDRSLKPYKGSMDSSRNQYWKDYHMGGKGVFLPLLPYLDPRGSLSEEICDLLSQTPTPMDRIRMTISHYLKDHPEISDVVAS